MCKCDCCTDVNKYMYLIKVFQMVKIPRCCWRPTQPNTCVGASLNEKMPEKMQKKIILRNNE